MFQNFVSLGPWCNVAASMKKYGLRNWSGPFDWLGTPNFESVLHFLENDFSDFLERENLIERNDDKNKNSFIDNKYNIVYLHENLEDSIYSEKAFEKVYEKYKRKLRFFAQRLKQPNCFLRIVLNQEEMDYIIKNQEYIRKIIKKGNTQSTIIFFVKKDVTPTKNLQFQYYIISGGEDPGMKSLDSWFDDAEDFLVYAGENFNGYQVYKNLMFTDKQLKINNFSTNTNNIIAQRYKMLVALTQANFKKITLPENIVIYGAGNIGKYFYKQIKGCCSVKYFIDKNKASDFIEQVPILQLDNIKDIDIKKTVFIVTPVYDYSNIHNEIKKYFNDAVILSLEDLLKKEDGYERT